MSVLETVEPAYSPPLRDNKSRRGGSVEVGCIYPLWRWTRPFYQFYRTIARTIWLLTIRTHCIGLRATERSEPFILAPTHLGHLEPFVIGTIVERHIDWMTRIEFYRRWWCRAFLDRGGCFPVRRIGV